MALSIDIIDIRIPVYAERIIASIESSTTPEEFDGWRKGTNYALDDQAYNTTALAAAAKVGNIKLIKHIAGLDKQVLKIKNIYGQTALFEAVEAEQLDAAVVLLELGSSFEGAAGEAGSLWGEKRGNISENLTFKKAYEVYQAKSKT